VFFVLPAAGINAAYGPIIADEACMRASDIPTLRDAFDGVNVKLDKSGGCWAYRGAPFALVDRPIWIATFRSPTTTRSTA
jgi:hypothetical protein